MDKAEGDFASMQRELRARTRVNLDSACFHAQQCAEKYMKAVLQEHLIPFGKTHNLVALVPLLAGLDATWGAMQLDLNTLSFYSVAVRYPGSTASRHSALDARRITMIVRAKARGMLGLST